MKILNLPNEQVVKTYIAEIFAIGIELAKTKNELHRFLQKEIAALASEFFLTPKKEFILPNFRGDHYNGHIDVVWAIGSIPIVAIEIDSALREKSVRKLLASNANLLFWVYYGNRAFEPLVSSIDTAGRINVLHFPSKFEKFGVNPQNPKPIENAERPVENHI